MASGTESLLEGRDFSQDQIKYGDCVGGLPKVEARVTRDGSRPSDEYYEPITAEEFQEDGMAYRRVVRDVSCEDYQRLVELGAPVLACADCPAAIEVTPQT